MNNTGTVPTDEIRPIDKDALRKLIDSNYPTSDEAISANAHHIIRSLLEERAHHISVFERIHADVTEFGRLVGVDVAGTTLEEKGAAFNRVVQQLREELEQVKKERDGHAEQIRVYKVCDQHYRDQVKPIRHLWPLENNPGIGQLVEAIQSLSSELAEKDKVLREYAAVGAGTGTWARKILSQYATINEY